MGPDHLHFVSIPKRILDRLEAVSFSRGLQVTFSSSLFSSARHDGRQIQLSYDFSDLEPIQATYEIGALWDPVRRPLRCLPTSFWL